MPDQTVENLSLLRQRIRLTAELVDALRSRCRELETENAELRSAQAEREKKISALSADVEFLTLSYRLADNPTALADSRRQISRLIRTIDNCISLLKE